MKKIFLVSLIIFYSNSILAQKGNSKLFREYEDTLKIVASKIMNAKSEEEKNNLKWFLLRKSIIEDKQLSISPSEVEDFIKDALEKNESQKAEIERFYKKESNKNKLSDDLLDQKIIDMLKEHSKIKEKDQNTSDLQGAQPNL